MNIEAPALGVPSTNRTSNLVKGCISSERVHSQYISGNLCECRMFCRRYYVLHKLPALKFLDSRPVKDDERKEAQRVGAYMRIITPAQEEMVSFCTCWFLFS